MTRPTLPADRHAAALDWLFGRINYERATVLPYGERQLKLDRMRQLLTRLGSPDAGQRIIHIAGTKGKGSTAAMVAAILKRSGRRVGVYSSPHLERIEERFAIDGHACSSDDLVRLVDHVRPVVESMDDESANDGSLGNNASDDTPGLSGPTFFDVTTAMALVLFAEQNVDATVLEVGLGGRLDSTNVCHPVVAAVTSIGLDHTKQLGNTLEAIAGEKAGIIKPGTPVVSGEVVPGPQGVIAKVARENGSRLIQRGVDFDAEPLPATAGGADLERRFRYWSRDGVERQPLRIGLAGDHQATNAATALAIVEELNRQGWQISADAQQRGLAETRLPARVEWFSGQPRVVIDAAHNGVSAAALAAAVTARSAPGGRTLLLALSRDKDARAIVDALAPVFDRFVATCFLDNPRAVPPDQVASFLTDALESAGRSATVPTVATPAEAWREALALTPVDGVIVATGSFFLAAEVRPLVREWCAGRNECAD